MFFPITSYTIPSVWDDFFDEWEVAFPSLFDDSSLKRRQARPSRDLYRVKLDVAHYSPEEINVKVENGKLIVVGKHESKIKNGYDASEFRREYNLPEDVMFETLAHRVMSNGTLVIEAKRKQPEVRKFFDDQSTNDRFKVVFDIKGYNQGDVTVSLSGNDLVVQGGQSSESSTEGRHQEQHKSFKRVIKLGSDVDLNSLRPVWENDGYLSIEGVKDQKKLESNITKLNIEYK